MPRGDKYLGLKNYLINSNKPIVTLSFSEIEKIIGNPLPQSAYKHAEAWWSNNYDHSQAIAWVDAGYNTDCVSDTFENKSIVFIKVS